MVVVEIEVVVELEGGRESYCKKSRGAKALKFLLPKHTHGSMEA